MAGYDDIAAALRKPSPLQDTPPNDYGASFDPGGDPAYRPAMGLGFQQKPLGWGGVFEPASRQFTDPNVGFNTNALRQTRAVPKIQKVAQ